MAASPSYQQANRRLPETAIAGGARLQRDVKSIAALDCSVPNIRRHVDNRLLCAILRTRFHQTYSDMQHVALTGCAPDIHGQRLCSRVLRVPGLLISEKCLKRPTANNPDLHPLMLQSGWINALKFYSIPARLPKVSKIGGRQRLITQSGKIRQRPGS